MNYDQSQNAAWSEKLQGLVDHIRARRAGVWVLCGDRGTGKTQMATCVGKFWIGYFKNLEKGSILYCRVAEYFCDLKESYDEGARQTEREVIRKYVSPELLVIDEFQERMESPWEKVMFDTLIDKRYAVPQKMTLLVGNIKTHELADSLGPSIYDRMLETGGVIEFDWPSFRGA